MPVKPLTLTFAEADFVVSAALIAVTETVLEGTLPGAV
jgi:hypothetical protein